MKATHFSTWVLFAAMASLGQAVQAYDLAQAYADAVAVDPVIASADAALQATKEKLPQARALELPVVNGTANINRQAVDTNLAPTRNFTAQNYALTLTYPLYRAQNIETIEQAKLTLATGEAQLASAKQDLIVKVAQAYFDVLASQDSLAVVRAQKRAVSEQLESAKRNFEVGTATITDQQEAQARADLVIFQEIAGLNDLETKLTALSILTGKPISAMAPVNTLKAGIPLAGPQPSNWIDWSEAAKKNNYAVQQAAIAVENAKREFSKQRLGTRLTADLVASIGHSENALASSLGIYSNSAALGVQLALPFYSGGAIESRIREAAANLNKTEFDLMNAKNQADLGSRQTYLSLNSLINQTTALEAAEKSSRLALDSNQLGYQVGVRINIDVLNAQQQVFSTQRDLSKVRYDVLINGLRLKATAAALKPDDIAMVNNLLEVPKQVVQTPISAPSSPQAPTKAPAATAAPSAPPASAVETTQQQRRPQPGPNETAPVKQSRGGRSLKPVTPQSK